MAYLSPDIPIRVSKAGEPEWKVSYTERGVVEPEGRPHLRTLELPRAECL
jgi:hypothetical protein